MSVPLVFPIGLLCGTFPDQTGGHYHEIRRGGKVHELSNSELAAWAFAHGPPNSSVDTGWTRSEVEQRLRATGVDEVDEPATIVAGLLERGLMVEAPTEGDPAVAFARAHRAVPIMYGLGNSPEEPWRYSIGPLGHEVGQVTWPVFHLWAWGHLEPDLWRGCETFAEQERATGGTDPVVSDPARVLAGFLGMVHGLLNAQAVYLDPASGGAA
jgi:hypothetical protein